MFESVTELGLEREAADRSAPIVSSGLSFLVLCYSPGKVGTERLLALEPTLITSCMREGLNEMKGLSRCMLVTEEGEKERCYERELRMSRLE